MDDAISTGLLASLLDLDRYGMRVVSTVRDETTAEVWVKIETVPAAVGCEGCGVRARPKDCRNVTIRDLEVCGRPLVIVWRKRVWQCPGRGRRTEWVSSFVDLDGGGVLDLVEGREGKAIGAWLHARPQSWLDRIEVVAMDPHRGYYNAVTARLDCPVVLDPFHCVRLANRRVDQARRRVQRETLSRRGRKVTKPMRCTGHASCSSWATNATTKRAGPASRASSTRATLPGR